MVFGGSRIFFKFSRALISLFYGIKLYNMCVCCLYRDTLKKKKKKRQEEKAQYLCCVC